MFSLYPELVIVVVRADANIRVLADLAGKRVNIGGRGTGTRATWDAIAANLGTSEDSQTRLTLKAGETTSALCSGVIDANFLMVGHPSPLVSSQLSACQSNLIAIEGSVIDKLVDAYPFYVRGSIPTELYGISEDILTIGSPATLVTSASTDPQVVAAIAKAILTHVTELRNLNSTLSTLKAEAMVRKA